MTATAVYTHHRNFVAPLSEFDSGRKMFRTGKRLADCITDEQARGWLAAEAAGCQAYLKVMEAEHVPYTVALAGLDALTAPGWSREPAIEDDYEFIRRGC